MKAIGCHSTHKFLCSGAEMKPNSCFFSKLRRIQVQSDTVMCVYFPACKSRHVGSSGACIHKFAWEVMHNFTGGQKQVTEIWGRNSLVNTEAMIISQCMVGIESYHTPRNVGTIWINKADSLGQGCGKRTRGTVCAGTYKDPHILALQMFGTENLVHHIHKCKEGKRKPPVASCKVWWVVTALS